MTLLLKHGDTRELLKRLPDNCKELNRNFIGFELDTDMFKFANDLLA